jgi:muramoyltetrapeptide carboxypeptidase
VWSESQSRQRRILLGRAASVVVAGVASGVASGVGMVGLGGHRLAQAQAPTRPALPPPLAPALPLLKAPRLQSGQTIGLVAPSGAVAERLPLEIAIDTLTALGFKVKESPQLRARRGHFAGTDAQRATAVNALFADPQVHGVLAITGGSGANRILPLLDYAALKRTPKFVGGFSDITALLHAVHSQTGLVTYHCPAGVSEWNDFSWRHFKGVVMDGAPVLMRNEPDKGSLPAPREDRTLTIRPGVARGPLLGGNLAVLSSLCGSGYLRSFDGAILFLEEVNEFIYRVDRMLSTLKLAGILDRLSGVMLGAFTNCTPGEGFGTLTLDEVFEDYFGSLGVPVYRGASFGHIKRKFTLPLGVPAEIDATAGTVRLLESAVL